MKEKITKRELLEVMKQIEDGERGQEFVGLVCILAFLVPIIFAVIFASCSTQRSEMDIVPGAVAHTLPEQSYTTAVFGSGQGETYECSQTRYNSYNPERDYEVEHLSSMLSKHGITVFRIDPNNPEHQRRYKRHLSGDLNLKRIGGLSW